MCIPYHRCCELSSTIANSGDTWVPVYPSYQVSDEKKPELSSSRGDLKETREFWSKKARASEEDIIQRSSPLKLLKVKGTSDDLTKANIPSITKVSSPPSKPSVAPQNNSPGYTIKQIVLSPGGVQNLMRPNLVPIPPTAPVRHLLTTSPQATNKWASGVSGPSGIPSVTVTPSKPPLPPVHLPDSCATIPILPAGLANGKALIYETPKQQAVMIEPSSRNATAPGSVFVPKYTPANIQDPIIETLAPLPTSPTLDDQYRITDWEDSDGENGGNYEDEDVKEQRRMEKHVPLWCNGWVETAKTQTNIDPDTVFGTKLPKCDLSVIFGEKFKDNAYMRTKAGHRRGSSGEWGLDVVTRAELEEYRNVMGHTQQLEAVVIIQQKYLRDDYGVI